MGHAAGCRAVERLYRVGGKILPLLTVQLQWSASLWRFWPERFPGRDLDLDATVEPSDPTRFYRIDEYAEDALNLPKVQCPVLQFHGLDDWALLPGALNDTWDHVARDWTLVTLPGTGHWAHHEEAELVTSTMKWWLAMRR